jgi:hypothetical protein
MELVILLVCFGLSAGTIGKIKGASFWIWFGIGFCLPLLGTLAALVARREQGLGTRSCEECGTVVAVHDQVCKRCGADLWFPESPDDEEPEHQGPPPGQQQLFGA